MPNASTTDPSLSEALLNNLNPQQQRAVSLPADANVAVIAGAGTGKTSVLTRRMAWLMQHGVPPSRIMAVTFTNKASQEMKDRLGSLVGEEHANAVNMGTFHSLGRRMIQRHHAVMDLPKYFTILDEDEAKILMMRVVRFLIPGENSEALADRLKSESEDGKLSDWQKEQVRTKRKEEAEICDGALAFVEKCKESGLYPAEYPKVQETHPRSPYLEHYIRYEKAKHQHGGLDFSDLVAIPNYLFLLHPHILKAEQERLSHILVDEFQDVNDAQYAFIRALSDHGKACHTFIVGDEDQSIYGWRGSRPELMSQFGHASQSVKVKLEENYRCSPVILDAANAVIQNNPEREEKNLFTQRRDGEEIFLLRNATEEVESANIASLMKSLADAGVPYSDMAVLYRGNALARGVSSSLVKEGVPYRIFGDVGFYGRKEIKDAMAWLHIVANPRNDLQMDRALQNPPCGIGPKTHAWLSEAAETMECSLYDAMMNAVDKAPPLRPFLDKLHGLRDAYQDVTGGNMAFGDFVKSVLETRSEAAGDKGASLMFYHGKNGKSTTDGKDGNGEKGASRVENLEELASAAARFESRFAMEGGEDLLSDFLAEAALMVAMESGESQNEMVSLMTIHKSKGLEFGYVFVVGCEEGVFPSMKDRDPRNEELCNMEEERRLFYVAGTRAKHGLCLSTCETRMLYGQTQMLSPSRFIGEVPAHLIHGGKVGAQHKTATQGNGGEDMVDFKRMAKENRNKTPEERDAERERRNQAYLAEMRTRADNRNRHIFRLAEDPRLNDWERDFIAQMAVRAERDIRERDSGAPDPFTDSMVDKVREIAIRYREAQATQAVSSPSKGFEPG
ncbi:MAG: ATP-dependent helicase [Acidithiobacillus sp.]